MSLEQELIKGRTSVSAEIEALGYKAYGERFDFIHTIPEIRRCIQQKTAEELDGKQGSRHESAGASYTIRPMGKAGFAHLMQNGEKLQIYLKNDDVPKPSGSCGN